MSGSALQLHWITPAISDGDIERLSERNPELCFERTADGDLVVTPPAGSESGRRNAALTAMLATWNKAEGKGVVFDSSAGFKLPDSSLRSPDAAWVERARWERLTPSQREGFAPICPDVVFELVSRTDRGHQARQRIESFRRNGASLAILIDPYERTIEVDGERRAWEPVELKFPTCNSAFVLDPQDLE